MFGQYGIIRQGRGLPLDVTVLFSVDGTKNFKDQYSPAVDAIMSRTVSDIQRTRPDSDDKRYQHAVSCRVFGRINRPSQPMAVR